MPKKNDDDNDDDNGPFPPGFSPEELQKKFKELQKKLNEGFGDDDDDDNDNRPRDLEKLLEDLKKKLGEEFGKELNPFPKDDDNSSSQFWTGDWTDDQGNKYELKVEDGKVTATFKPKNGDPVIKQFDSVASFKKGWPEFAKVFPKLDKQVKLPKKVSKRIADAVFDSVTQVLRAQLQIKDGEGLILKELADTEKKGFFKRAGLQRFDIILSINNKAVTGIDSLSTMINEAKEGSVMTIQIIRKGQRLSLKAKK